VASVSELHLSWTGIPSTRRNASFETISMNTVTQLKTVRKNTKSKVEAELSRTGGLLRLAPAWVPRSFLQPGLRLKLHPDDTYAYGANRGGID